MESPAGCGPTASLQGEAPTGRARGAAIERDVGASFRGDAPAGQRTGHARNPVGGEEKARGAGGLRGKAETAGSERCLYFGLRQAGDERATLQTFFKGPGRLVGGTGLDNEKARWIQPCAQEPRAIRASPFAHGGLREAPQHETLTLSLHGLSDDRKRKAKSRGRVAIGVRLDLMEAALLKGAERAFPIVVGGGGRR